MRVETHSVQSKPTAGQTSASPGGEAGSAPSPAGGVACALAAAEADLCGIPGLGRRGHPGRVTRQHLITVAALA